MRGPKSSVAGVPTVYSYLRLSFSECFDLSQRDKSIFCNPLAIINDLQITYFFHRIALARGTREMEPATPSKFNEK